MDSGHVVIFLFRYFGRLRTAFLPKPLQARHQRIQRSGPRSDIMWNLPSRLTEISPAVSSSLRWWERVAGEMARAGFSAEQLNAHGAFASRSSNSNRLGSAKAFSRTVRRARERPGRRAETAVPAEFIADWMQWYRTGTACAKTQICIRIRQGYIMLPPLERDGRWTIALWPSRQSFSSGSRLSAE